MLIRKNNVKYPDVAICLDFGQRYMKLLKLLSELWWEYVLILAVEQHWLFTLPIIAYSV